MAVKTQFNTRIPDEIAQRMRIEAAACNVSLDSLTAVVFRGFLSLKKNEREAIAASARKREQRRAVA